jgi:hypothetical protein
MWADRILIGLLVLVGAAGLMSVLPGTSQTAVSRLACRVGSLGLSSCAPRTLALGFDRLNPPRCPVLATLDQALPEVRTTELTTAAGLRVGISATRSGATFVEIGDPDASLPPDVLAGERRLERTVLPGATVPAQTQWSLPDAQGVDAIVDALESQHQRWQQRRSSLAVLGPLLAGGGREVPEPTLTYSRLDLSSTVLPYTGTATAPRSPAAGVVTLLPGRTATLTTDRIEQQTSVVADLSGTLGGHAVSGALRWTRDGSGTITHVLLALVSDGPLTGKALGPAGSVGVAYVDVPVRTAAEQDVVSSWLSAPAGFSLGLGELLYRRPPKADNLLASFLTRAATVTVLRYSGLDAGQLTTRTRADLVGQRRAEWTDARLVSAAEIDPEPNGTPRVLSVDPTCGTP